MSAALPLRHPAQRAPLPPQREQPTLWATGSAVENPHYLTRQLLTYLGNKRALLRHIGQAVDTVKRRIGKPKLRIFDAFSGSGVVSRFLKGHASLLICNDIERYAEVVSRCYLRNRSTLDLAHVANVVDDLNNRVQRSVLPQGFIEELYAPRNEKCISLTDRVFYTRENARRLDTYRRLIEDSPRDLQDMLLGPLLSQASIRANTAGVFKGFYKNRHTKVGQFGGTGADALDRITGQIRLDVPVLSRYECEHRVERTDSNELARHLPDLDLAYLDPPYNQHPYGSNYFMLNLIVTYSRPANISAVSGIPTDWQRSGYNVRSKSARLLEGLLESLPARFLLVSFNNEGFISLSDVNRMLERLGPVQTVEVPYNAFRGSRNFKNRPLHVTEQLFLVEKR